jgi:O-antigen/teichoic acid export membrane protein
MSSKNTSHEPAGGLRGSESESFARGYLWSLGATVLPLISAFVASLIIARWMGPVVVGLISLTQALATTLLIIAKFGVEGAASRLVSEYQVASPWRIPRLVRLSVYLRLLFTVPTAIAATVFAPQFARFFGDAALLPLFRLGGLLIFAVSINEHVALVILGLNRFKMLFGMRIAMLVLKVALVLAAALLALGATSIMGAYIVSALIPGFVILAMLLAIRPGETPAFDDEKIFKRLISLSGPLAVSGASVTVYSLLDKLMLGYFSETSQLGLYTMARNIVETSLFPTFALVMTLRPALAAAYTEGDRDRCSNLVYRSITNSFLFSTWVVVVLACVSKSLVIGLFTDSFLPSANLLMLFFPYIIMRSLGSVILPGLVAAEKAGIYARLTLLGAALNFALNAALIPHWGAVGAVVATLTSYLPVEVLGLIEVNRAFRGLWRSGDWGKLAKTVVAGAGIVLIYHRFIPEPAKLLGTLVHACLVALVFAAVLFAAGIISGREVREQLRSVRGRGSRNK